MRKKQRNPTESSPKAAPASFSSAHGTLGRMLWSSTNRWHFFFNSFLATSANPCSKHPVINSLDMSSTQLDLIGDVVHLCSDTQLGSTGHGDHNTPKITRSWSMKSRRDNTFLFPWTSLFDPGPFLRL